MNRRSWLTFVVCGGLLAAGSFVAGAYAAPIRPNRVKLSPMVQSLASVDEVQLLVKDLPADLEKVGVTRKLLTQRLTGWLEKDGVRVVEAGENPNAPELQFLSVSVREPKVGDALAYVYILSLHQKVTVRSTETEHILPTWTVPILGLERTEDLEEPTFKNMEFAASVFLRDRKRAQLEFRANQ